MKLRGLLALVKILAVLAASMPSLAHASSSKQAETFEPALRDMWERGSERFHRQWMIAGPVGAKTAASIDPSTLSPIAGQPVIQQSANARWAHHTSWTDITDLMTIAGRPVTTGEPLDQYIFVAASLQRLAAGREDLLIGSERPYVAWLNGEEIYSRSTAEGFAPDRDRIPAALRQGENLLLLRFHETNIASSQFSLRAVPRGAAVEKTHQLAPVILPSAQDELAIRTHFEADGGATVHVTVVGPGGEVIARSRGERGDTVRFDTRKWRNGAYEIRLSTDDHWRRSSARVLPWYRGDAITAVRNLIDAAATAPQDVYGASLKMLAEMAKDRLGGSLDNASPAAWRLVHAPLMEFEELQHARAGRVGGVRANGFVRLAYVDPVDGSTQFCRAYLPGGYSRTQAWPLVAFLHGFNPANPAYVDWWDVDQRHHPIAAEKGTIVVEPHGRGNAQYTGIGERDVLRCIEEAKRRFSVDADRVYLTGESMGGHGTWSIASRHPDIFAAAAPVYGGWDFRVSNVSGPPTAPAPSTALDAYSLERASSFANAENLLNVPMLVVHGDADAAVSVENSRHAVQLLQRWGYNVRYHEMPGWAHEDLGQRGAIVDWLLTHKRVTAPRAVRLRSADLAGASAYWLSVQTFENASEVIRVSAQVLQPGLVRVDSSNVASFALNLPESLRGAADSVRVVWNGESHEVPAKNGSAQLKSSANPSAAIKRAGLEGPLPAVLATPFVVVIGTTSSDPHMREIIQARADWLAQQWLEWQKQPLRMMKDTEVRPEHEKQYSLILIGGADANSMTRRLSKHLPFSASSDAIIVDGREWKVKDAVLQAIYPSPGAADRYVYVVTASSADGMYFWTPQLVHFVAGYPVTMFDWVIQDGRRPPAGTMNPVDAFVASGVLDASWKHQDQLTVIRDEQRASSWTLRRAPQKGFVASASALKAVVGSYELFPGVVLTFRAEGTKLVVDTPERRSLDLATESDWIYVDAITGSAAEFIRDEQGNVIGASIDYDRGVFFAKRMR